MNKFVTVLTDSFQLQTFKCDVSEVSLKFYLIYEGWNFNSGNYLFTTDTKYIHVSKFYCPLL